MRSQSLQSKAFTFTSARPFFAVNELGLKKSYENNCELSLALRLISALSFVPTDLVEQSFESVLEEIEHVLDLLDLEQSLSDKIHELASYFQRINKRRNNRLKEQATVIPYESVEPFPRSSGRLDTNDKGR